MLRKLLLTTIISFSILSPVFAGRDSEEHNFPDYKLTSKCAKVAAGELEDSLFEGLDLEDPNHQVSMDIGNDVFNFDDCHEDDLKFEDFNFQDSAAQTHNLPEAERVTKRPKVAAENPEEQLPPAVLTPLRNTADFRKVAPKLYTGAGLPYKVPTVLVKFILSFITDFKDIESLSLVSRGLCNWVDARTHLKVKSGIDQKELLNLLRNKTKLGSLNLSEHGNLTDAELGVISSICPNLTSFNLAGCCKMTDAGLEAIATWHPNLTSLNLKSFWKTIKDQITDAGLRIIGASFPKLTSLNLKRRQRITDDGIRALAEGCRNLTSLDFYGYDDHLCEITDNGLRAVAKGGSKLTRLKLDSDRITDEGLSALAEGCPELTTLKLWDCNKITDNGLRALANSCPKLTWLELWGSQWGITDDGLRAMAANFLNLRHLDLSYGNGITEEGLYVIAASFPSLTYLNLKGINIDYEHPLVSASRFPSVKALDLTLNEQITDQSLNSIVEIFPNLTSLVIVDCNITHVGLQVIVASYPNLTFLDISGCGIPDEDMLEIAHARSFLRIVK